MQLISTDLFHFLCPMSSQTSEIETSVDICSFNGSDFHYSMRRCPQQVAPVGTLGPPIVPYVAVCDVLNHIRLYGFATSSLGAVDDGCGVTLEWETGKGLVRHEPAFPLEDVYALVEPLVRLANAFYDEGPEAPDLDKFRALDWKALMAAIRADAQARYAEDMAFLQKLGDCVRNAKRKLSTIRVAYYFGSATKRLRTD